MEVLVEAASEVPQGCFVSVRLGDNLKQRRFDKSSAKYHFPVPEEKRKARIDVYQLVGTCSVQVKVISSDPKADGMKLRVSSASKEMKAEDTAKQRQEIEAETKDAAVGYLAKHGIEQRLSECLRTLLRMKPEDPVEFMCKFLKAGVPGATPEPAVEKPAEKPAEKPSVSVLEPPAPSAKPEPSEASREDARAALMKSVRGGDLIGAVEEESTSNTPFTLRPSVGTWYMPLPLETAAPTPAPKEEKAEEPPLPVVSFGRKASTEMVVEAPAVGDWLLPVTGNLTLKGLGTSTAECCEVERVLTKALLELGGELQGEYVPLSPTFASQPGGIDESVKASLKSKSLLFEASDLSGRGVFVTDAEDVALWLNASKHLQILVNKSAKKQMIHKIAQDEADAFHCTTAGHGWASTSKTEQLKKAEMTDCAVAGLMAAQAGTVQSSRAAQHELLSGAATGLGGLLYMAMACGVSEAYDGDGMTQSKPRSCLLLQHCFDLHARRLCSDMPDVVPKGT
ncbi:unnamed protein product [Symbiodinium pilosum]|uniref:Uncharacterized protein n=1 Tax=Symbiodinium pilosum TaxID=2952 RepID=A0A812VSR8_SYMPI|nr:unnamed protein product [Symbiodinium pilosum]